MNQELPLAATREIEFFIQIAPRGKGRPRTRVVAGEGRAPFAHVYTDAATKKYEAHLATAAMTAKGIAKWTMVGEEPLRLDVIAFFLIPKSKSKKLRVTMDGKPAMNRIDGDNILKALMDATQDVLFLDDKVVTTMTCQKVYVADETKEGLWVRVATCG